MKTHTLLATFLMLISFGFAQSGAKIDFLNKDNTIDFGVISKESDNGVRFFEFKNTGNAPLIISNVQSTCSCMTFTKPDEPILPGKSGRIEVRYNLTLGTIRKTITVESNAINYDYGKIPLKIKGEVILKTLK
jgi:hypothetical protein